MNSRLTGVSSWPSGGTGKPGTPCAEDWAEMLARIGGQGSRPLRAGTRRRIDTLAEIEKERARIGRELHSGAGQPLACLKLRLEVLDSWFEAQTTSLPPEVKDALAEMRQLTDAALAQVRALSHRLHPPEWQDSPIAAALESLVRHSGISEQCAVSLEFDNPAEEPSFSARIALYRCAQECISNAIRHSGASEFGMALHYSDGLIHLTVRDNGSGIPECFGSGGGIGLTALREYASLAGGTSLISGAPGGTTIQISVPITEE